MIKAIIALCLLLQVGLSVDTNKVGSVKVSSQRGSATGIVLDKDLILTNAHVVKYKHKIQLFNPKSDSLIEIVQKEPALLITNKDEHVPSFSVLKLDNNYDLALLRLETPLKNYNKIKFADDDYHLEVGDKVYSIGCPFGIEDSLIYGYISKLNIIVELTNSKDIIAHQIQMPVMPGQSGGAVFNTDHECIGIVFSRSDPAGLGHVIPSSTVLKWLEDYDKEKTQIKNEKKNSGQ